MQGTPAASASRITAGCPSLPVDGTISASIDSNTGLGLRRNPSSDTRPSSPSAAIRFSTCATYAGSWASPAIIIRSQWSTLASSSISSRIPFSGVSRPTTPSTGIPSPARLLAERGSSSGK